VVEGSTNHRMAACQDSDDSHAGGRNQNFYRRRLKFAGVY